MGTWLGRADCRSWGLFLAPQKSPDQRKIAFLNLWLAGSLDKTDGWLGSGWWFGWFLFAVFHDVSQCFTEGR
jgi:hypothetical protein